MTETQIKEAIRTGIPFFSFTSRGEMLARYVILGPVFHWEKNKMIPTTLQGDDLCWWLQANGEDSKE